MSPLWFLEDGKTVDPACIPSFIQDALACGENIEVKVDGREDMSALPPITGDSPIGFFNEFGGFDFPCAFRQTVTFSYTIKSPRCPSRKHFIMDCPGGCE